MNNGEKEMMVIHGDLFEFNSSRTELMEVGHPENVQAIGSIKKGEETVSFWYDRMAKSLLPMDSISYAEALSNEFYKVDFPALLLQRGAELPQNLLFVYNEKSRMSDSGFQYVTDELRDRFKGVYAEMRIDGLIYDLDLGKMEIRQKDDPEKKFTFGPEAMYQATEKFYNTQTKQPVYLTSRIAEFPEHVVCFSFPPFKNLDPIGYCLASGYPPSWLVCKFQWNPIHLNMRWKALGQTRIPELIRRNQIEQELQGRGSNKENISRQNKAFKKFKRGL
ncbi:hypothetical protein [Chitinophaga defluvii]|uniref:Uncharacterized protein n=1 Tax=Chitinophaga defluvii TaxID=3163343 RepID=A0ABV2TEH4_9BACT